jgi:hypothetical protein
MTIFLNMGADYRTRQAALPALARALFSAVTPRVQTDG